jgi:hypothetical protein
LLVIAAINLAQPLSGLSDAERVSTCFLPLLSAYFYPAFGRQAIFIFFNDRPY